MIKPKGVHHLALLTKDMDATVKFYTEVLEWPVVVTLQLPDPDPLPGITWGKLAGCKHYFFDIGNGARLAFFSWNETLGDAVPEAGAGHHFAFTLDTEDELDEMRDALAAKGVEVSAVINHFFCKSIYFRDPNGIHLEFAVFLHPCSEEQPFLQDPEPTPATRAHLGDKLERFRVGHEQRAEFGSA